MIKVSYKIHGIFPMGKIMIDRDFPAIAKSKGFFEYMKKLCRNILKVHFVRF